MRLLWVLTLKILREQRFTLLFCMVVEGLFFVVGAYLFDTFGDTNMDIMSKMSPQLIAGVFGGLFGSITPLETWLVTLFVHPLVLTLLAVIVVSVASRSLAGEIDRGTIEFLLSGPVRRYQVVLATTVVLVLSNLGVCSVIWLAMLSGLGIGGTPAPESLPAFAWVLFNLFALHFAISGVAAAVSAWASEQGKAIGRVLGFVVISFFVNVLASLWPLIATLDYFSVYHYHRPQPILEGGGPPAVDLTVLLVLGVVGFILAFWRFTNRDISTV